MAAAPTSKRASAMSDSGAKQIHGPAHRKEIAQYRPSVRKRFGLATKAASPSCASPIAQGASASAQGCMLVQPAEPAATLAGRGRGCCVPPFSFCATPHSARALAPQPARSSCCAARAAWPPRLSWRCARSSATRCFGSPRWLLRRRFRCRARRWRCCATWQATWTARATCCPSPPSATPRGACAPGRAQRTPRQNADRARGFVTRSAPGSLAADDEAVWRHLTLATFTVPLRANPPTPGGWRGLYKCAARGSAC